MHFATTQRVIFFGADGRASAWTAPQAVAGLAGLGDALRVSTTDGAFCSARPGGSQTPLSLTQDSPGTLSVSAIPEPSTDAVAAGVGALGPALRRRRNQPV
ncbi:MAG TPA: hypothetical protein VEB66_08320 [Opitutaceae bacterium]|nr:hypothetical protein [Opitutaceae bacterium]